MKKPITKSPYEILGVPKDASVDEMKRAYRRLAKQHHPDRGGDDAVFAAIGEAWRILSTPTLRAHYDSTGQAREENQTEKMAFAYILQFVTRYMECHRDLATVSMGAMIRDAKKTLAAESAKLTGQIKRQRKQYDFDMEMMGRLARGVVRTKDDTPPAIENILAELMEDGSRKAEADLYEMTSQRDAMQRAHDILCGYLDSADDPSVGGGSDRAMTAFEKMLLDGAARWA